MSKVRCAAISLLAVVLPVAISFWLVQFVSAQNLPNPPIVITTQTDLTGNAAAQQIASSGTCRWVTLTTLSANSAVVRIGDSNVGATRGIALAPGGPPFTMAMPPYTNFANRVFGLSTIYFYAATNDKLAVTCGN